MQDRIVLGEFIAKRRNALGKTQAELAQTLGVSNKAVSKWETCEANPELSKLPQLALTLGVSTDELLACKTYEPKIETAEHTEIVEEEDEKKSSHGYLLGVLGVKTKSKTGYEFVSDKHTKRGTPYVHINLGWGKNYKAKAKGLLAIGNVARGLVGIGMVSVGLLSAGILSIGLLAVGVFALGLLAGVGALSLALGAAVGAVAVGTVAVGAVAVGVLSLGGVAVGVFAHTSSDGFAVGIKIFIHAAQIVLIRIAQSF